MPLRTVGKRPGHNPYQLPCPLASCHHHRWWFRNQSGLIKHLRSCHSGQATSRQCQLSYPANSDLDEAWNTPIHKCDESSSQNSTLLPTWTSPLAVSWSSPPFSPEINQATFNAHVGSFSPVPTLRVCGSSQESSQATPKSDEPILKVFHPVINSLCMSQAWSPSFLLTNSSPRVPLWWTWWQFATKYTFSSSTYGIWHK